MKKFFALIFLAVCLQAVQAQDITNKTGTDGSFVIQDEGSNTVFSLKPGFFFGEPKLRYGKVNYDDALNGIQIYNSLLDIQTESISYGISNALFSGTSIYGPSLVFSKARGTAASPQTVVNTDWMGQIEFWAYTTKFRESARIQANVLDLATPFKYPISEIVFFVNTGETNLDRGMAVSSTGLILGPKPASPTYDYSDHSRLNVNGSLSLPILNVGNTAPYDIPDDEFHLVVNGGYDVSLPDPQTCQGRVYVIRQIGDQGVVGITVLNGGFIDNETSVALRYHNDYIMVQSLGGDEWSIISRRPEPKTTYAYIGGDGQYTLNLGDYMFVGQQTQALTINLPEVQKASDGKQYIIRKGESAGNITITPVNTQEIEGGPSITLDSDNEYVVLQAFWQNGSPPIETWLIIGGNYTP